MAKFKKSDLYYGAFLSVLLNNGKAKPSLFDDTENQSRRIYKFATDRSNEDYIVFTKYTCGKMYPKFLHWKFNFTDDEVEVLQDLNQQYGNVKLALICLQKEDEGEVAIISYEDAVKCMGITIGTKSMRINIKTYPNKHGIFAFGSGLDENEAIKISRDAIKTL